ncbi:cache domain-containing protein [Sulfitobacter donghicola]|uniref:histidine kinase n=1 Tax=Sulfitobacter donghicola DSW-25 = KCTC 12864 = JCM 14565 TaxID=1300350 RepID=A0A073IEN2_9RHOB|nr:cache domain-containing protein [Sulfitobacter donghicola]KEJ87941.1 histidine kinase [Sulfitobacter donghicola DSW-25 = KCTC 12864 = JCM 14565]KIN66501.1 Sensor protein DegS [Sulfitobacter donghicola DSW-25 = KCTC 12864 = JCM 14565]
MNRLFRLNIPYGQKLALLATLPLVIAVAAIAFVVAAQSRALAEREISALETQLIEAKKAELRNYVTQARNGFYFIYGNAAPDDGIAKERVAQILSAMIYGEEGQFFVYDYDGTAIVSPRETERIGQNFKGETDSDGAPVVDRLIEIARDGAGYHTYTWPKPSSGVPAQKIVYVTSFPSWGWAVGTGVYIDDILASVASSRAEVEDRVQRTFLYIGAIALAALLVVFASGMGLNLRERWLADAKLKKLTQRVFDAQEEERGRVARELHDGISQILVGVRYALDNARRRLDRGDPAAAAPLAKGISSLAEAISEVRRISRDLRPGVLDDLGLGPALRTLAEDFGNRTGIDVSYSTVVFRNRLDVNAKTALYRIAQEALTNIERHADATHVIIDLRGHKDGATLRIVDNGRGFTPDQNNQGLGLRNMQERMDQLGGLLYIRPAQGKGLEIKAIAPLSHMLPPAQQKPQSKPQ